MGLNKMSFFIIAAIAAANLATGFLRFGPGDRRAFAEEAVPGIQIQNIDPSFDSQKLAGPGASVHSAAELDKGGWKVPNATERDHLFQKSGLTENLKGWDALDRDLLFSAANNFTLADLLQAYPKLPQERLKKLSKLAKSGSKKEAAAAGAGAGK